MILHENIKDKVDNVALRYEIYLEENKKEVDKSIFNDLLLKIMSPLLFISPIVLYFLHLNDYTIKYLIIYLLMMLVSIISVFSLPLFFEKKFKYFKKIFFFKSKKITPFKMKLMNTHGIYTKKQEELYEKFMESLNEDEKHIFNSLVDPYKRIFSFHKKNALSHYIRYYINKNNIKTIKSNKNVLIKIINNMNSKHSKNYLTGLLVNKIDLINDNEDNSSFNIKNTILISAKK
jgi:hypothetical protein